MSNSTAAAVAPPAAPPAGGLSDAQLESFWNSVLLHEETAKRTAAKIVPKHDVEDIVHSAAILFIESFSRPVNPAAFPDSEESFRKQFLTIVRNHALDCVRTSEGHERPAFSQGGVEAEPLVGGRKLGDRPLDEVFARNDEGQYDAEATADAREQDDVDELWRILRGPINSLTKKQHEVITQTFMEGRKRAEVAARLGISVKTYDNHLQAAFMELRDILEEEVDSHDEADRSIWWDRIEHLVEKHVWKTMGRTHPKVAEHLKDAWRRRDAEAEQKWKARARALRAG